MRIWGWLSWIIIQVSGCISVCTILSNTKINIDRGKNYIIFNNNKGKQNARKEEWNQCVFVAVLC